MSTVSSSTDPLFVVGLGGHTRVIVSTARAAGLGRVVVLDGESRETPPVDTVAGARVVGTLDELVGLDRPRVAVAIGDNNARQRVTNEVRERNPAALFPPVVHPSATIEDGVALSDGVAVCLGVVLATGVRLSEGALVNSGAIVDHDGVVGAFAHIAPGARLAGAVAVGDRAHVGLGACVLQERQIGHDSVVGAGAVVLEDVADGTVVVGVPARVKG